MGALEQTIDLGVYATLLIPFFLVLTRVTGLMLGLPALVSEIAPVRIRAAFAMALAAVLTLSMPAIAIPDHLVLALILEFVLGVCMGLVVRVALGAVELAGELAGMQLGFGFNQLVDPFMMEPTGPLTRLISGLAAVLLFVTGAHHELMRALAGSLRTLPPGTFAVRTAWARSLVDGGEELFSSGLRIALPIIFVVLASNLVFGLLTRVAPELNLWSIGFAVSIGVGLVSLWVFAPNIVLEIRRILEESTSAVVQGWAS